MTSKIYGTTTTQDKTKATEYGAQSARVRTPITSMHLASQFHRFCHLKLRNKSSSMQYDYQQYIKCMLCRIGMSTKDEKSRRKRKNFCM